MSRNSRRRSNSSSPVRGRKATSKRIGSRRSAAEVSDASGMQVGRGRRSNSRRRNQPRDSLGRFSPSPRSGRRSASRGRRSASRGRRSASRRSRDSLGRFSPSKSRSKSRSRSRRGGGGRRNCWSDWTLGELRMLTKELGGRMFQDRARLCSQLTKLLGLEEALERAQEVEEAEREAEREERRIKAEELREERRAKAEERRLALGARRGSYGVQRRVRTQAPVNPSSTAGAYPGAAQAIEDFLAAYRGKSYKTQSARTAAMRRDLRDRESRDRRQSVDGNDAASYQAWKREPWNYDLQGIDTRGSDDEFIDNFTRGGFYEGMSQDGLRSWEQSPAIQSPEFGPAQQFTTPGAPTPTGDILEQMRAFAARNRRDADVETGTPVTPLSTAAATPLPPTSGEFGNFLATRRRFPAN